MDITTIALLTLTIPLITAIISFVTALLNLKAIKTKQEQPTLKAETTAKEIKTRRTPGSLVRRFLIAVIIYALPAYNLFLLMSDDKPLTKLNVLYMCVAVVTIVGMMILRIVLEVLDVVRKLNDDMYETSSGLLGVVREIAKKVG